MVSFFQRTRIKHLDGMRWYQQSLGQGGDAAAVSERYHRRIATEMIQLLDEALGEVPVLEGGRAGAESAYRWAVLFAGGGLAELVAGDGPPG